MSRPDRALGSGPPGLLKVLGTGGRRHPVMAVLRVELHAGDRQLSANDVARRDSKDPGFAIGDPIDGRTADRAEVVGHRGPGSVTDTVYLQPVVGLGLAANLNRLVR